MNRFWKCAAAMVITVGVFCTCGRAQTAPASAPAPVTILTPTAADDANNKALQDEGQMLIDMLLDDLRSNDAATQQKAQKQLVSMGDSAIPTLEKYLRRNPPAPQRQRAQAVLDELETRFTFDPTLITIHMTDAAPQKVFEELTK